MIKNKFVILFSFLISTISLVGCDTSFTDIIVRQSINNLTSDTIVVTNSKNEFRGFKIKDTIVCLPFSETIFFDAKLRKQPLEPYDMSYISQSAIVSTSSKRNLTKDIFDNNNWEFKKRKKQEWLQFSITENDLK